MTETEMWSGSSDESSEDETSGVHPVHDYDLRPRSTQFYGWEIVMVVASGCDVPCVGRYVKDLKRGIEVPCEVS